MRELEAGLARWTAAGVIDSETAARIRTFEEAEAKPTGSRWQVALALIFGGVLLGAGIVLFVAAHWDQLSPAGRFLLVLGMMAVLHGGGLWAGTRFPALSTTLHGVGTVSAGAAIALVGQIFHIEEHWPAAILLWAVCALAGWVLLKDQVQQTLVLLLLPAWLFSEWTFATEYQQGGSVYLFRMMACWATLYLTFFLHSRRKLVLGVVFAAAALTLTFALGFLCSGWTYTGWRISPFLSLHARLWGWLLIAVLPIGIALLRRKESFLPVVLVLAISILLPFCEKYTSSSGATTDMSLWAYLLLALVTVFLAAWGVRHRSRALINVSTIGFALVVLWFYNSSLWDKLGRSLGLIVLGILFLAGGWLLERGRRRMLTLAKREAQ